MQALSSSTLAVITGTFKTLLLVGGLLRVGHITSLVDLSIWVGWKSPNIHEILLPWSRGRDRRGHNWRCGLHLDGLGQRSRHARGKRIRVGRGKIFRALLQHKVGIEGLLLKIEIDNRSPHSSMKVVEMWVILLKSLVQFVGSLGRKEV
jgi:hypothetical protein